MNLIKKIYVTVLILMLFLVLNGCVSRYFKERDPHPVTGTPAWTEQISFSKTARVESEVEYAQENKKKDLPDALKNKNNDSLIYDHVDRPITSLVDYSLPKKKINSASRKTQSSKAKSSNKKKISPKYPGPDFWKGYETDARNVNILVNNPKEKDTKNTRPTLPLSRIEKQYNQYGELTKGKKIRQFGYNLIQYTRSGRVYNSDIGSNLIRKKRGAPVFSQDEKTRLFSQSREENVPYYSNEYTSMRPVSSEYIIAPGDEVFIKITGPAEIAEVFAVDRNGLLFIPKVGTVHLAGKKASELQSIVAAKVKQTFNKAHVEASLGRLRTIQVTITGNVINPGLIEVAANSSLLNALAAAGGPGKNGTLRNVELRRRNQPDRHIDLYGILLEGDWNQDPSLLPDDIIHIGPIGKTIAVMSPGDNGSIYEILDNSSLKDLGTQIGVSDTFTDIETVLVEKNTSTSDRIIAIVDYKTQGSSFILGNGDIFQFFPTHPYSYNTVRVTGPVLRPGTYPFSKNMRVNHLLKLARGFLTNASLNRALLIRELGPSNQFDIMPEDKRGKHRKQLIWLDLAQILAGDNTSDLFLTRLDRLKIFTMNDQQPEPTIRILGGVRKPGEYHLTAGMTLGDLMKIAGGPSEKAYNGESSIVRRRYSSDTIRHFDVGILPFDLNKVLSEKKASRILLKNHDKIVIRQVNNLEVTARIDGWVQFPGTYILPSESRIEDLVRFAGGFLPVADLRASIFKRRRVSNLETLHLKNFFATTTERFARTRDEVTLKGNPSESLANQLSLLGRNRVYANMGEFQTTGRVVIDLTQDDFPDTDDNLILEDGDSLTVPQKMTTIMVMGRIFNPSGYLWKKGLTVGDYLEKSGGLLEDADPDHVYVVMANGEVKSAAQKSGKSKLLAFKPNPGDIVFVPQKPLGRSTMAQVMDALQLIRMAVGTAAIGAAVPNIGDAEIAIDLNSDNYQKQTIIKEFRPELYESYRQWKESNEE
jgi:protein involved in polysaccharide export with SLBB domain